MHKFFYWSGVIAWTVSLLFLIFAFIKTRRDRRENILDDDIDSTN